MFAKIFIIAAALICSLFAASEYGGKHKEEGEFVKSLETDNVACVLFYRDK
jgi:hypothetical protein